jgi:hypothetical protein
MNVGVEESGVWYSCGYPGCLFRTAQSHRMERHSTFHTDTDRYEPNIYEETKPSLNVGFFKKLTRYLAAGVYLSEPTIPPVTFIPLYLFTQGRGGGRCTSEKVRGR